MIARTAFVLASVLLVVSCGGTAKSVALLNLSFDPTRELYAAINPVFAADWKNKHGQDVIIDQSHAGSGKQARAVIDGVEADVVTLALAFDIDAIASKAKLLPADWQNRLPNQSTPYYSTIEFLVRKGNPKHISDWNDLVQPGIKVITPNPKTSGGARWNYLAAWGYALRHHDNDAAKAKEFVAKLYRNVPMLDTGARGSTTTFVKRQVGDVLLTWESEITLIRREFGADTFQVVNPSLSIKAEPPIAVIDKNTQRHGTEAVAKAYLEFLYTEAAQRIIVAHNYRPTLESVVTTTGDQFAKIDLFTIDAVFGGWAKAQATHFADGGIFDQITTR
ncbi:MAG: sulfate ABC transporter substrate-binding protein [Planctomycetota bacterium]